MLEDKKNKKKNTSTSVHIAALMRKIALVMTLASCNCESVCVVVWDGKAVI